MAHIPVRTCVGCRKTAPAADLVRLFLKSGTLFVRVDPASPGRGAWLHRDRSCLARAVATRAFARAFRGPVTLDEADLGTAICTL